MDGCAYIYNVPCGAAQQLLIFFVVRTRNSGGCPVPASLLARLMALFVLFSLILRSYTHVWYGPGARCTESCACTAQLGTGWSTGARVFLQSAAMRDMAALRPQRHQDTGLVKPYKGVRSAYLDALVCKARRGNQLGAFSFHPAFNDPRHQAAPSAH